MNRIIVSIQSFGDIITNSSSEIFCTITGDVDVLDFIADLLSHVFDNYGDREIDPLFEYKVKEDMYSDGYTKEDLESEDCTKEELDNKPDRFIEITLPYGCNEKFYRAGLLAILGESENIKGKYKIDFND